MFELLNSRERANLARCLRSSAQHALNEACLLAEAAQERPSVLEAYALPRNGHHAWFDMSVDASLLVIEVTRRG